MTVPIPQPAWTFRTLPGCCQLASEPRRTLPHDHQGPRRILESEYGYHVGGNMYLGVVHASLDRPRLIKVPVLQEELELVVADQISKGLALSYSVPGPAAPFRLPA